MTPRQLWDEIRIVAEPGRAKNSPTPRDGQILALSRTPTAMGYDNHKFFFLFCYVLEKIHGPLQVIHIDQHWDTKRTELSNGPDLYKIDTIPSAFRYCDVLLQEGDFLLPALQRRMIKDLSFLVPSTYEDSRRNIQVCSAIGESHIRALDSLSDLDHLNHELTVLDLDLDFFFSEPTPLDCSIEVFQKILSYNWLALGISTSPHYCGGPKPVTCILSDVLECKLPIKSAEIISGLLRSC